MCRPDGTSWCLQGRHIFMKLGPGAFPEGANWCLPARHAATGVFQERHQLCGKGINSTIVDALPVIQFYKNENVPSRCHQLVPSGKAHFYKIGPCRDCLSFHEVNENLQLPSLIIIHSTSRRQTRARYLRAANRFRDETGKKEVNYAEKRRWHVRKQTDFCGYPSFGRRRFRVCYSSPSSSSTPRRPKLVVRVLPYFCAI